MDGQMHIGGRLFGAAGFSIVLMNMHLWVSRAGVYGSQPLMQVWAAVVVPFCTRTSLDLLHTCQAGPSWRWS